MSSRTRLLASLAIALALVATCALWLVARRAAGVKLAEQDADSERSSLAGDEGLPTAGRMTVRSPNAPTVASWIALLPPDEARSFAFDGLVVDAITHLGLAGARVEACFPTGEAFQSCTSDESGSYRLEIRCAVPEGVALIARAEGFAPHAERERSTAGATGTERVDFALRGAFRIAGRVLAERDRRAIPLALVRVAAPLHAFQRDWEDGFTDASGRFEIEEITGLPRSGLVLTARADAHRPVRLAGISLAEEADALELEILLPEPLLIRGRVVDGTSGEPIAGASIELSSCQRDFELAGLEVASDGAGRFELTLGDMPLDGAILHVAAAGRSPSLVVALDAFLREGVVELEAISLGPRGTLRGRVLEAHSRVPIADGEVYLRLGGVPEDVADGCEDVTVLGADGDFELAIEGCPARSSCTLTVLAPGYVLWSRDWPSGWGAQDRGAQPLEVVLERAVLVQGALVRSDDGRPIRGALVRVVVAGSGGLGSAGRTTRGGEFELELSPSSARGAPVVVEWLGTRFNCGRLGIPEPAPSEVELQLTIDPHLLEPALLEEWERESVPEVEDD